MSVVLGYSQASAYTSDPYYLGATVGRFAGRIDRGRFVLDGNVHALARGGTGGMHCLHGGSQGFHSRLWTLTALDRARAATFRYVSPAGEQGFPGRLEVEARYELLDECRLMIEYRALADAPTVVNLSNHAYFNLSGCSGPIDGHRVKINADRYTPLDPHDIPTGEMLPVEGTRFDLRVERTLGSEAFDQNFVLNKERAGLEFAASVAAPAAGIRLNLYTTQPGLQLYTGDQLASPFRFRAGLCLEAQHFPDSPNQAGFPSCRLNPGEHYCQQTLLEFEPESD